MKKSVLAIVMMQSLFALAQNGSVLEYKITSTRGASGNVKVHYSEYGSISEMSLAIPQMPGGGMKMKHLTMASSPDVIYKLDDENGTYSEMPRKQKEENTDYKVTKLGEETVNGYKCVHALVKNGNETHEVWNTKDVPGYEKFASAMGTSKQMGSVAQYNAMKAAGCEGVPVKSFHKGNDREGDMTMELVKLERKNFSKSDFDLPAGYVKSDRPAQNGAPQVKSQQEIMNMTPEERTKYIEEMKKKYGK